MTRNMCLAGLAVAALLLAACDGGQRRAAYTPADASASDADTMAAEQPGSAGAMGDETPMPVAADELFDDFFFNYATSRRLQLERTAFPLPVSKEGQTTRLERGQWKMEHFFMRQEYYTLLFDSPQQMELVKDTSVAQVVVERIQLDDSAVSQYLFDREKGIWMLREIRHQQLAHNPNAQFFSFYQQFVADSLFQHQSLAEQIDFVGPDPDDDFQMLEGVITPDFWDAFRPDFPRGELYNIVYGHQNPAAPQKIFVIRGIANGMEVEVTFSLQNGKWKVVRLIT